MWWLGESMRCAPACSCSHSASLCTATGTDTNVERETEYTAAAALGLYISVREFQMHNDSRQSDSQLSNQSDRVSDTNGRRERERYADTVE